jgi:carbon storage regulator
MLLLTRKINERIMIGDDIIVTIADIDNGKVRIGIDAPRDVKVHRQEIYDLIERKKKGETDHEKA